MIELVRVARGTECDRLGGRHDAHLGRVGLRERNEARAAQARYELGVARRRHVGHELRAEAGGVPRNGRENVFDHDRHARERERTIGVRRARFLVHRPDDRVDLRVDLLGARDRGVDHLARLELALLYERSETESVVANIFVGTQGHWVLTSRAFEFRGAS
jgi:hypothetical protein